MLSLDMDVIILNILETLTFPNFEPTACSLGLYRTEHTWNHKQARFHGSMFAARQQKEGGESDLPYLGPTLVLE